MKKRCAACERIERVSESTCLGCGVQALVDADDAPVSGSARPGAAPERLDRVTASAPRVRCDAPLSRVLDGLERRAVVLVTGEPSAGKSTEIARLSFALGWQTAWLDAEMSKERVRDLFARVGASERHLGRVERIGPPRYTDWREALGDAKGRLVVVDSLHEWAGTEAERQELLTEAKRIAERALVIVVAHWAREGHASGSLRSDHRVAACVTVERDRIVSTKCWWAPLGPVRR